jgi:hypothetical protein
MKSRSLMKENAHKKLVKGGRYRVKRNLDCVVRWTYIAKEIYEMDLDAFGQ